MAEKLSAFGLILKKMSVLVNARLDKLENKLQMQVEGLPYVDFDYDFEDGDLIMEYVEGTDIIEDNINYDDGDLIITPTNETS